MKILSPHPCPLPWWAREYCYLQQSCRESINLKFSYCDLRFYLVIVYILFWTWLLRNGGCYAESVITGIGIISCLGNDVRTVGSSLRRVHQALSMTKKRRNRFRSPLTGTINGFDAEKILSKKQRKRCLILQYSLCRFMEALTCPSQARNIQNERTGLIFGCDSAVSPL
jgi:hypothetical protein